MNIVLFAAMVSAECMWDYCLYYEYMFSPPTSGVQVVRIDKTDEYLVFSGRKSSSQYMEGLNIFNSDSRSSTYHTRKDVSINSPAPRSQYGLFDANQ